MEFIGYRLRPGNSNIVREVGVRTQQPTTLRSFAIGFKMHHLAGSVHTGIGAAGANNVDGFVGNTTERGFYVFLNTVAGALPLPAVIRGSVVLDA
jgi:hypothetical protein